MLTVAAEPLDRLRARTSEKWVAYPPDVLPLFVAETDYPIAPVVADAVLDRIRASDTGYVADCRIVGEAFAGFARRRWAWDVDPAQVRTTTDVGVAIVELLRLLLPPGSDVVIMPPVYPPFYGFIPEAGHRVAEVPLLTGDTADVPAGAADTDTDNSGAAYRMDLAGIGNALRQGARAVLLCNPHNPVGVCYPTEELAALAELAAEHEALVISDEIHGPLTHPDGTFVPFLTVSDAAARVGVCVTSASKGWNIAGFKCALMVTDDDGMTRRLDGLNEEVLWRTSILGLHATAAAYTNGEEWLDATVAAIVDSRRLLADLVRSSLPGVRYAEPRAGYLGWLDFSGLGWAQDPADRILAEARVALVSGPSFGSQGKGFARINFACSPEVLQEAVQRIRALI